MKTEDKEKKEEIVGVPIIDDENHPLNDIELWLEYFGLLDTEEDSKKEEE